MKMKEAMNTSIVSFALKKTLLRLRLEKLLIQAECNRFYDESHCWIYNPHCSVRSTDPIKYLLFRGLEKFLPFLYGKEE